MKAEDVLNALEDLSQEEFEKFKWFLQQPESLPGSLPPIKRKELEGAKSLNIVDLMVHTYTLQRCMEVTSSILGKIHRNDLLERFCSYENPENKMCPLHQTPLNLLSQDGKTLVCRFCSLSEYKQFIPQSMEYRGNTAKPRMRDSEIQQMIKMKQMHIQEMKELMKTSKDAADKQKAEGVQIFTALKGSADRGLEELIKMEDQQKTTEKQAEDFIKDLEQEISELKKMSSEGDFHQSVTSMRDYPPNKNWVEDSVCPPSYQESLKRALPQIRETAKKLLELQRVQQFAVDVTLDPKTSHPKLILSDDGKQVKHGNVWKKLPDNPERFTVYANVLGQQSFSSGRFYFEVQVKGKTDWDLGVARESVDRKGDINVSTEDGFWALVLRNGNQYSTGEDTSVLFPLHPGPEKVGVFVDYEEGLVSFYDVDAADLIYSFTGCCFSQKLYPYFSPFLNNGGRNSAPLIICPVNQADG